MKEDFDIASLMVSKICHDLIGSSNALAFSLEEIFKGEEVNKDTINLAYKSAEIFTRRLKYFRAAFGISFVRRGESLVNDLRTLIFELGEEKDIHINWSTRYDYILEEYLNKINFKLFLNVFLLIFYQIPKSANIEILIVKINPKEIAIMLTVKGYRIVFKENILEILNGNSDLEDINPGNIHLYFTSFLKEKINSRLEVRNSDNNEGVKLAFTLQKTQ